MANTINPQVTAERQTKEFDSLGEMANLAVGINALAKQLDGAQRTAAYRLKAVALSALILAGAASVNGRRERNTFALDINVSGRRLRLHCTLPQLLPDAQAEVLRLAEGVQVTAPLWDRLSPDALRNLESCRNLLGRC